jgi:hypothetical protein
MPVIKAVEYSYRNLSTDSQILLLCLAPFQGVIKRYFVPFYIDELEKIGLFQDYEFNQFDAAIREAINWGLLSPIDSDRHDILTIQPIFTYFLNTQLETLAQATCQALREGFKNHYLGVAGYYQQLINSKDASERELGKEFCRLESKNLYNSLQFCVNQQESIEILLCLNVTGRSCYN